MNMLVSPIEATGMQHCLQVTTLLVMALVLQLSEKVQIDQLEPCPWRTLSSSSKSASLTPEAVVDGKAVARLPDGRGSLQGQGSCCSEYCLMVSFSVEVLIGWI